MVRAILRDAIVGRNKAHVGQLSYQLIFTRMLNWNIDQGVNSEVIQVVSDFADRTFEDLVDLGVLRNMGNIHFKGVHLLNILDRWCQARLKLNFDLAAV